MNRTTIVTADSSLDSFAASLAENGVPAEARLIYQARNRVYAYTLPDGREVNIKAFKVPRALNPYIYTLLRKSKARRSYENSERLRGMGFHSPAPLAYVEVRSGVRLRESYFVSEQLKADDMRHWETKPDCAPLLEALAAEMVRLCDAGVWHKDLSPGNILYTRNSSGGYLFSYIDLNRMKFGVGREKIYRRMFRAVNIESMDETMRLGRLFGLAAGIDPMDAATEAGRQLQAYRDKKRRLRALKNIFRRNKK